MQAVVKIGGNQYRISPEQVLCVEKLSEEVGSKLIVNEVLFYQESGDIRIGKPYLSDVKVEASILEKVKGPKIRGFKYKRRKNYHRSWGHRQSYYKIKIDSISV